MMMHQMCGDVDADIDDAVEQVPLADLLEKSSTIEVDGKNIYKASVINSLFSSTKLSKDPFKKGSRFNSW